MSIDSNALLNNYNLTTITIGLNVSHLGSQLLHTFYNHFRDAYLHQELGGAGTYVVTHQGYWTKAIAQ